MLSDLAQRLGEEGLTFVQGVAITAAALCFGAAAGIGYAAGELGARCFGDAARCETLGALVNTTYTLLGIAIVGLVLAFATKALLDLLPEDAVTSD